MRNTLSSLLFLILAVSTTLATTEEEENEQPEHQNLRRDLQNDPKWFEFELDDSYQYMLPMSGPNEILGGVSAGPGEFPFFVSLEYNGQIYCGGSLIGPDRVLSAAHCFFTRSGDIFLPTAIRVGHLYTDDGETVVPRCVKIHPEYGSDRQGLYSDVAIIKLAQPVTITTDYVQLSNNADYPATQATPLTAIGFGLTTDGGYTSGHLLKTTEGFVTSTNCKANWACVSKVWHVCANGVQDGGANGVCNGDSGGPLLDGANMQVGITSFGSSVGCGSSIPDVFANVGSFNPWITGQLTDDTCTEVYSMYSNTPCKGATGICAMGQVLARVQHFLFDFLN